MRKNILTLTFLIAIQDITFSQGNLQFNKVINLEYNKAQFFNNANLQGHFLDSLKVPSNKVWKVESAGMQRYIGAGSRLMLNNFILDANEDVATSTANQYGFISNGIVNYTKSELPIWLSSGQYILKILYVNNPFYTTPGEHQLKTSLSIIEFNIVP